MPGILPAREARVLAALLRLHYREGRSTIRTVASEARYSIQWTMRALQWLEREGLVSGLGIAGALRPRVRAVPFG